MATLAKSSVGLKAAHAAVRNLAESYGVDLLPLELDKHLTITPVRPQSGSTARKSCDISRTSSLQEDPPTPSSRNETPSLPRLSISSPKAAAPAATSGGGTVVSPVKSPLRSPHFTSTWSPATTPTTAGHAPDAVDAGQSQDTIAAAAVEADEDQWAENSAYLSEAEYIQYQMPLEQQLFMLEEERDILVDKLLSTTATLHASEARNRESQASASQVAALLNQLQELLRRAEVERDKAKLQLKRQRMSASQVPSDFGTSAVVAQLAAAGPMPAPIPPQQQQQQSTSGSAPGSVGGREDASADHLLAAASSSSAATPSNPGGLTVQHRLLKKHKNNVGLSSSSSLPAVEPHDAYELPGTAAAACIGAVAPGFNEGRSRRSSNASASSCVDQLIEAEHAGDAVALMPSSNEARPPVKSVIDGFEALMKHKARESAAKAAAVAAARRSSTDSASASSSRRVSAVAMAADASDSKQQGAYVGTAVASAVGQGADPAATAPMLQPLSVVPRPADAGSSSSNGASTAQQQLDYSSIASTPTAAAIHNASPTAFAAEAAQAAAGVACLEAAMAASYAEVAKRNSSDLSASSSRDGSRSPPRRAVRSPRKAVLTSAAAASRQGSSTSSPKSDSGLAVFQHTVPCDSSNNDLMFDFGHTNGGSSKRSSSSSGSRSPRARSPPKHSSRHGSSRLGPSSAGVSKQLSNGGSYCEQQQQHDPLQPPQHPKLYDPAAYASSTAAAAGLVQAAAYAPHQPQQEGIGPEPDTFSKGQPPCLSKGQAGRAAVAAVRSSSSVDAAVQVVEPPGGCTAEIRTAPHPAAAGVASRNLSGSGSSSGQKARARSSSPKKKRAHGGQQRQKRASGSGSKEVSPADAADALVCPGSIPAADSKGAADAKVEPSSRSRRPWLVLKLVIIAVLLLATAGLVAAVLLRSMQPAQHCGSAATAANGDASADELQARLAAMQQEVVMLQRQLSERSAACDAAAAISDIGHPEL